mgnify:CR=1 FL=1
MPLSTVASRSRQYNNCGLRGMRGYNNTAKGPHGVRGPVHTACEIVAKRAVGEGPVGGRAAWDCQEWGVEGKLRPAHFCPEENRPGRGSVPIAGGPESRAGRDGVPF